jgi:hypothetical protein
VAAALAAAWLSARAIPYNMDEFVHYQALACATAPLERALPPFRDGCSLYDLRLPLTSTMLPLRSYLYVGSVAAVPFYPFWRVLGDPIAVRVQGGIFLLLSTLLAARVVRVRVSSLLLASLVFPVLTVTFLVDEGPVGLSALALLLALLALRRALAAASPLPAAAWASLAGLALFVGLWAKLLFVWWLPAVAYFAWSEADRLGQRARELRRATPALAAFALAFALPSALLLASVDRDGRPYLWTALYRGHIDLTPRDVDDEAVRLWQYAVDGSLIAPRNLVLPSWPVDVVPALEALAVLVMALGTQRVARRRDVGGWTAAAGVTFVIASSSLYSQWPHHFAFPLLLLVMALAVALDGLGRRGHVAAALVAALFWTTLALRWPAAAYPADSSFAKDAMLRFVRDSGLDRTGFQVHSSWGTYYIAQLFGDPARVAVYLRALPDDPRQLAEVRALARSCGRSVLLFSSRRWERLHTPAVGEALGPPGRRWRFGDWWAVEYARLPGGENGR